MSNKKFIPVANPFLDSKERNAVNFVVRKKWITMGKKVKEFENKFAQKFGAKYATMVNSGSSANLLMFSALKNYKKILKKKQIYN